MTETCRHRGRRPHVTKCCDCFGAEGSLHSPAQRRDQHRTTGISPGRTRQPHRTAPHVAQRIRDAAKRPRSSTRMDGVPVSGWRRIRICSRTTASHSNGCAIHRADARTFLRRFVTHRSYFQARRSRHARLQSCKRMTPPISRWRSDQRTRRGLRFSSGDTAHSLDARRSVDGPCRGAAGCCGRWSVILSPATKTLPLGRDRTPMSHS